MKHDKSPPEGPTLDKAYDPHAIEKHIYQTWEQAGHFKPSGTGPAYCIMIPPPNVTGNLHMGHAFNNTIMDALTRWHRMRGDNTLWQPGTDHAGIATQMVVERQLNAEGKTRHDLGRDQFIERVWTWKAESGGNISRQLRRLGSSVDWSRERFTMDPAMSEAVTEVFVRLHEEGLIYRGKRLVNWDPVLHTAVSDLEVVSEEEQGSMWHIRYPIQGTKEFLVVATTRPETLLGDSAVAVHPEDERYKHLIGKQVELPLTDRSIPVIADDYVDKEFGSGCVKITPAHDFNDYAVWQRHKDDKSFKSQPQGGLINIFRPDASLKKSDLDDFTFGHRAENRHGWETADSDLVGTPIYKLIPEEYRGLDRYVAREKIVADLEAKELLAEVKPHKLMVPRGDRSGAVVEPFLTDQWYVKAGPLAEVATKVVEDGRIKFIPENWSKTYYEWMRNIQDWCISRQIWWGHRIPAWYDEQGNYYVGRNEAEVRARHKLAAGVKLKQDEDVLDTWFSSALWPFSTLGWPEQTQELKTFYPTSVLVTGFDIIFFWVARMVMMGMKFMDEVPFKEVYIHGLVRDAHGHKMSKSKGNVLDPIDLIDGIDLDALVMKRTSGLMQPQMAKKIEQATRKEFPKGIPAFGTDALRFTFASQATQGRDIKFDLGRIEGYRNFCNKLWNAARYVLMNTEGKNCGFSGAAMELTIAERWIISRLHQTISDVETSFREYRFDLAAQTLYHFTWNEFCDWYLELSKVTLAGSAATTAREIGTRHTLVTILETLLRLLHPLMPFITEEIWQRVAPVANKSGNTIMLQPYPISHNEKIDKDAIAQMEIVMGVISAARNIRSERDVPPSKQLPKLLIQDVPRNEFHLFEESSATASAIVTLSKIKTLEINPDETISQAATALVGTRKVQIPLGSLINKQEELARIQKEIDKIDKELAKARGKLANQGFVARAPAQVVEQEKTRVQDFETARTKLAAQRAQVEALAG